MKTLSLRLAFFLLATASLLRAAQPSVASAKEGEANDPVTRAMRDELARSMAQLQLENLEKPYFISYRLEESRQQSVAAQFGSALGRSDNRDREAAIEVRVGSPAFDNTNFQVNGGGGVRVQLPTDDNYDALRRQLWLATDAAYKRAVEQYSRKKAALQNKVRTDELPDFSPQPPATISDLHPGRPIDFAAAEALARELSAIYREAPAIDHSTVRISAAEETTRYLNSEGSSFTRVEAYVSITSNANTQASDGYPLDDYHVVYARSWAELPPKAQLVDAVRATARRLSAQRNAGLLDQYNGPVLFEGQAAAEIFSQVFAPLVGARPRPVGDAGGRGGPGRGGRGFGGGGGAAENPFLDKLGARVLPDMFTVVDNPTLTSLNGQPLLGDSRVDDEGVPSRAVTLVEKGRLKTLLVSRTPVRGVTRSTGSMHNGQPTPSNLIVTANDGLDAAALKAELLKLVEQRGKDFGIIVRRLAEPALRTGTTLGGRGGGSNVEPVIVAVKVFPDGREEPLRNIEVAGFDAPTFKDILVAGREPYINTIPFRGTICSFAVPSLLFEDVTLKKPAGEITRPPIAKHPFFDK